MFVFSVNFQFFWKYSHFQKNMLFNKYPQLIITFSKYLFQWYVSVVSTFPNTFALVLDSNLHDLNGTNPYWRCFQQNCHGVIYVQKQKFSEWPETPRNILEKNNKKSSPKMKTRGPTPCPRGWGARPPPGRAPYLVGP